MRKGLAGHRTFSLLTAICALSVAVAACAPGDDAASDGDGDAGDGATAADTGTDTGTETETETEEGDGTGDSTGTGDGEIVVSMVEDVDTLDPTFGQTFAGRYLFANMCEKLYDINADLEFQPQLADALPEFSDDAMTATITLRDGVTFNDGEPMDAEAVKLSLDRHREAEGSARAGELAPVTEVTVVDDTTVELQLSEPFAPLTAMLADRAGMILSPAKLDELGDDFTQDPVCVGPFDVVDHVVGDRVVLERSEHYYDSDAVHLDRVVFRPIPDSAVRMANLRSGELDIVDRVPTTDLAALEEEPDLSVESVVSIGHDSLVINVQSGSMAEDARVREAFELAIDRDQINDVVYEGGHEPSCQPFPPASPFRLDDWTCPSQDLEAAQALLDEAGVDQPVPVDFLTLNDTLSVRRGELIQAQAAEAGFEVSVRPTEVGTLIDDAANGNFDVVVLTWSGRVDPDGNVFVFQHSEGGQNFGGASDADIDELLEDARAEVDQGAREELYREAWEAAVERRHQIIMLHQSIFVGLDDRVTDFQVFGDGLMRLKGVSLAD